MFFTWATSVPAITPPTITPSGVLAEYQKSRAGCRPVIGEGNSAAFREFAWRFVNIIARALVALGSVRIMPKFYVMSPISGTYQTYSMQVTKTQLPDLFAQIEECAER